MSFHSLNKGYRCVISKEMSIDAARVFKARTEHNMSMAIPRYKWARDVRIEVIT